MMHFIHRVSVVFTLIACQAALAIDRPAIDQTVAGLAAYSPDKSAQPVADVRKAVRETAGDGAMRSYLEEKLIGLMESEKSTLEARVKTCEALWMLGSPKSLGVLERMLADEKDSHLACYAIGRQPSVAAGEVLARGLALAKGRAAVNVLNVMASRGEEKGWEAVARRYDDPDDAVSAAALSALAKMGTMETYRVINQARNLLQGDRRRAAVWAMLECAETMAGRGDKASAGKIYEGMMKENEGAVRRGALAGLIGLNGNESYMEARRAMYGNDPMLAATAVAAMIRDPQRRLAQQFLEGIEIEGFGEEARFLFFDSLARVLRRDAKDAEVWEKAAWKQLSGEWGERGARVDAAAIRLIGNVEGSADRLFKYLKKVDDPEREHAIFVSLAGIASTDAIAGQIKWVSAPRQVKLIRLLVDRDASDIGWRLTEMARSQDISVAKAALDGVGKIGGMNDLPVVIGFVRREKLSDESLRQSAEQAAAAIALRNPDAAKRADPVTAAFREEKSPVVRASLARVLGGIGGPAALDVLKGAMSDSETVVRDAALRALAGWQDVSAVPALLEVAKQGDAKDVRRAIALRGALRQLGDAASKSKGPAAGEVVEGFVGAAELVKSADEKRLLLSGVSQLRDAKAVGIVEKYLADAEVGAEAKLAAAKVAENVQAIDPAGAKRLRGK